MLEMPPLETERLIIRPFEMGDLEAVHRLFDLELGSGEPGPDKSTH